MTKRTTYPEPGDERAARLRNLSVPDKARMLGSTVAQLKKQYARNAVQLRKMWHKAVTSGKKVNGYTAAQLRARAAEFEKLAHKSR